MATEWTIKTVMEYVRVKRKADRRALKLQAVEYKRRLKILNGEAERLRLMQEKYLPREVYERDMGELEKEIKVLQLSKSYQEGKAARSQILAIISILVSIIAIVLSFIKK